MTVRFKLYANLNYLMRRRFSSIILKPTVSDRCLSVLNRRLFFPPVYYNTFVRTVHASKTNLIKYYYMERENLLAHEIMENNCAYTDTVVPHPRKTLKSENPDLQVSVRPAFENFYLATLHNLKEQRTLGDGEFTNLVISVVQQIPGGSFDEIRLILFCLCFWPQCATSYVSNFKYLWNTLDAECTTQLKNWSIAQKLLIADYWFHLRLSRISIYNTKMIRDLINNCNELKNSHLVQLMFCVTLQRTIPQFLLDPLEKRLGIVAKSVSLDELSIVCLGYFKTENKVGNQNVLRTILERTTSNIDNVNPATTVRLLKFLRKSFQSHITQYYVPLLKGCILNMKRWDLLVAVHTSLLCTVTFVFEPFLLDVIVEKVKNNIADARLKDFCKVVQCLSQFNYMPHSEFHEILFKEVMKIDRLVEAKEFPRDLLLLLLFYAYMGEYPASVIEHVLNPDFVQHCQNTYGDDVLTHLAIIDYCIEIECNEYDGPRLKPHLLSVLQNNRGNLPIGSSKKNNSVLTSLTQKVVNTLKCVITPDSYVVRHVLPHMFNPVIIIRLSSNNSMSLQQMVDACPPEIILKPPSGELWGCLIMCGPFSFPFKSKQLCGLISMKERQLKKLGYKVALIPYQEFPACEKQRESYLRRRLGSLEIDTYDADFSSLEVEDLNRSKNRNKNS